MRDVEPMEKPIAKLYGELAWLWPYWGRVEEYRDEVDLLATVARRYASIEVRTLLDVGCGGGKDLAQFRRHFEASGLDISEAMLALARAACPDGELIRDDMRAFELGRRFDAIYLNDALVHMTSREDLRRVFERGFAHLEPGGVLLAPAERTKESFVQNETQVDLSDPALTPAGLDVAFIQNSYDPDPGDDTYESTVLYLIREQGLLRVERDDWTCGLFPLGAWREGLEGCGFEVRMEEGHAALDGVPLFIATKPR